MLSQSNLYNTRSVLSNSVKREVLWNVLEPGDPYDIKRSMIARLPNDKRPPMGQHLELVCLLQAAEIERLCEFLEDYKLRFRDVERAVLDRHSYEVQIKELTVQIAECQSLKTDNSKLRDFVKKQSLEIESLQRNYRDNRGIDETFKAVSEKSAERISQLTQQNQRLAEVNEQYRLQIQSFNARLEAFQRAKHKEIEEIRLSSAQSSKESIENTLNVYKFQYEGEARRLEFQLKRLKQAYDQKNNELTALSKTHDDCLRELAIARGKGESVILHERNSQEYQKRLSYAAAQLEKLSIALREANNRLEESELRRRELERRVEKDQFQIKEYEGKLRMSGSQIAHLNEVIQRLGGEAKKVTEVQQLIIQYESKLKETAREREQINTRLMQEVNNSQRLKQDLDKVLFQNSKYKLIERENTQLKEVVVQRDTLRRRTVELENKVAFLSQQLERSFGVTKSKDTELERSRNIAFENEALRSKIKETEFVLTNKYESQLARIKAENEQRLQLLARTKGNQFQAKAQTYEREAEKLRELLKMRTDQSEKQRARIYQLENHINRFQIQTSSKLKNFEVNFTQVRKENEQLYLKSRKLEQAQRKIYEQQNKITQYERQCQRLAALLKSRQEELFGLKGRLRETEGYTQKFQLDVSRKITNYQQGIVAIRQENEDLRKKINEFVGESNKKLNQSAQEINKLNIIIRNLNEEKGQLDYRGKQWTQQNQTLKQNFQKVYKDNEELRAKIMELQVKNTNFFNESTYNSKRISNENDALKKQLNDYKASIANYEAEVNKRLLTYQQNFAGLGKQNEDLKRRIRELQVQSSNLKQELDISIKKLKAKQEEAVFLDANYKKIVLELQNTKRYHQQYEISVKNRFQGEVNNKYSTYQQNIQTLRTENDALRRKVAELESKFAQLAQEYERVTLVLRNSTQQNESLKKQINQKDNQTLNLEVDLKNRITNSESKIQNLIRTNEELQANLTNSINNFNKKNEELRQADEKYRQLTTQFEVLQRNYSSLEVSFKGKMEGEVVNRYKNYEDAINKLNEEKIELKRQIQFVGKQNAQIIGHLNQVLAQNQALRRKIQNYEASIAAYETEVNKRFATYEQNIDILVKEREDLIKKLQEGGDTTRKLLIESQGKLKNATQQLEKLSINFREVTERQNQELRRKNQEFSQFQRRSSDLENRLITANQEIQRLNLTLKAKQDEITKYQLRVLNQTQEIEAFRKQCNELQLKFSQTYEFQVVKKYNAYEQSIADLKKKLSESELKNVGNAQEIERLSSILKSRTDESSQVSSSIRSISSEYEEFKRKVRENQAAFNQNLNSARRENEDLRKKLFESQRLGKQYKDDFDRKVAEYENRIKIITQESERLKEITTAKTSQIEVLRRNLKEYEQSFNQTMDFESRNKSIQQGKITSLSKENQQLKKRLTDFNEFGRRLAESENRVQIVSQQNQRISSLLKTKTDELVRLQNINRALSNDMQLLKRNNQDLNGLSRTIAEYEQRISLVINQNEKLQAGLRAHNDQLTNAELKLRNLSLQNDELKRQINDYKLNWNRTSEDISRKTINYQQNLVIVTKQRDDLLRKRAQYESKITILNQQIERLNISYRSRTEEWQKAVAEVENLKQFSQKKIQLSQGELSNWQANYKSISNQYETAKKHIQEYEINIKKLYSEFQRLQAIINDLKRERQVLIQKNHALSQEINRLRAENQDLQAQTKDVRLRLSDDSSLQKRISEHMALMVVLFAEIESLRKRVSDKEREVEDVRRRSLSPNIL